MKFLRDDTSAPREEITKLDARIYQVFSMTTRACAMTQQNFAIEWSSKFKRVRSLQEFCIYSYADPGCVTTNGLHHCVSRSHSSFDKPMNMSDVTRGGCTIFRRVKPEGLRTLELPILDHARARASTVSAAPYGIETNKATATSGRKFHNCESRPTNLSLEHSIFRCQGTCRGKTQFFISACWFPGRPKMDPS